MQFQFEQVILYQVQKKGPTRKQFSKSGCAKDADCKWQNEILEKVSHLEAAYQSVDEKFNRVCAENKALSKELGRLRHLQQLRASPSQPQVVSAGPVIWICVGQVVFVFHAASLDILLENVDSGYHRVKAIKAAVQGCPVNLVNDLCRQILRQDDNIPKSLDQHIYA